MWVVIMRLLGRGFPTLWQDFSEGQENAYRQGTELMFENEYIFKTETLENFYIITIADYCS